MDPETALELVKHGVTVLLLDVPQYTLLGIDTQMFSVGPSFKGIKMIPPGPHFLYYSSSSRDGREFSPITGFFVDAGPSEVIVRRWDQREERLVKVLEEEEGQFREAIRRLEFDRQLGPYNLGQYGEWKRMSNHINSTTIKRLEPIGGDITVVCEPGISQSTSKSAVEKVLDDQLKGSKFATPVDSSQSRGCYYAKIPHVIKQRGVHGQELTYLNLDKTLLLENQLKKYFGGSEDLLLGELQFAFVVFLMGQSLEGFLQWKSLVTLLFECREAPFCTRSQLFTKFIKVIYHQLKFGLEKDRSNDKAGSSSILLDESWFSADSFLHHLCKDFFSLVLEAPVVDGDLLTWVCGSRLISYTAYKMQTRKLKELLENRLGWKFQNIAIDGISFDEDDEFAPVVVRMDDSSSS
ncbi:protein AAR2 homolog isoform X1 [Cucumis sativus]|uniref:protein AAR2 homolog isoform X1 n=1 Tax=Cucumis sativus TaxID=3659 RepID=UPI0012F4FBB9|nr:protein AAR2 homolog isoform X1 [Cucumis sativus]XP_031745010.1 protein AAR2 homolog isoform X1 [Cucumis sativus]XP_031745014.1 protein AAR2 homolog isoform X1 [Cucumis sativus]